MNAVCAISGGSDFPGNVHTPAIAIDRLTDIRIFVLRVFHCLRLLNGGDNSSVIKNWLVCSRRVVKAKAILLQTC